MCGINLLVGDVSSSCDAILAMNKAIAHRGTRETFVSLADGRAWLGHVRLPIQGLDPANDHPQDRAGFVGAFVGEIFNFREIQRDAPSDLPVLIDAFATMGTHAFSAFDGFWSAVLFDKKNKIFHIIVDFLAKKPLYMRSGDGWTGVSSEPKALTLLAPVEPDELFFSTVAKWGYNTGGRTPWRGITKIPPFTHLMIDPRTAKTGASSYGELRPAGGDLRALIEDAVVNRLVSDVPISLLLSGGLDSTIIFELVKKHTTDFTVFHVDNDEADFLNYLSFPTGISVVPLALPTETPDLFRTVDTPVDLGSVRPQLALASAIADHGLNVAISGDGADELFGGYRRAKEYDSQWSDIFDELVSYHLPRLDITMMSRAIELRCPFLARPVVEAALAVPYKKRRGKEILKELFVDIVPPMILNREKHALKIDAVRRNKIEWRLDQIKMFREETGL